MFRLGFLEAWGFGKNCLWTLKRTRSSTSEVCNAQMFFCALGECAELGSGSSKVPLQAAQRRSAIADVFRLSNNSCRSCRPNLQRCRSFGLVGLRFLKVPARLFALAEASRSSLRGRWKSPLGGIRSPKPLLGCSRLPRTPARWFPLAKIARWGACACPRGPLGGLGLPTWPARGFGASQNSPLGS